MSITWCVHILQDCKLDLFKEILLIGISTLYFDDGVDDTPILSMNRSAGVPRAL